MQLVSILGFNSNGSCGYAGLRFGVWLVLCYEHVAVIGGLSRTASVFCAYYTRLLDRHRSREKTAGKESFFCLGMFFSSFWRCWRGPGSPAVTLGHLSSKLYFTRVMVSSAFMLSPARGWKGYYICVRLEGESTHGSWLWNEPGQIGPFYRHFCESCSLYQNRFRVSLSHF